MNLLCSGLYQIYLAILADAPHGRDVAAVSDESVDLAEMADAHGCGPLELGGIRDEDHLPGIGDDCLRHLHLAEIEIEQRAVMVDGRGADDGVVDLELLDEINSGLADNAAVGAAHDAAGNHHLEGRKDPHPVGD